MVLSEKMKVGVLPVREVMTWQESFEMVPEHRILHEGLIMQLPTEICWQPYLGTAVVLTTVTHLIRRGIKKINCVLPFEHLEEFLIPFTTPNSDLAQAEQRGDVLLLPYVRKGPVSSYVRDDVAVGVDQFGKSCLVFPGFQQRGLTNKSNGSRFMALKEHHPHLNAHIVPIHFEGGNYVVTDRHILTLSDSPIRNAAFLNAFRQEDDQVDNTYSTNWLKATIDPHDKRQFVVLDSDLNHDEQPIFHLDLCLGIARDRDGREKILLSDMSLAQKMLEERGYRTDGSSVDLERWIEDNLDEQMGKKAMRRRVDQYVNFHATGNQKKNALKNLRSNLEVIHFMPYQTVEYIGRVLPYYFRPENNERVQSYLATIHDALIKIGFEETDIIRIPALLTVRDYKPYVGKMKSFRHIMSPDLPLPFYAPVNGVPYNLQGEESEFITGGGLKILDDEVSRILDEAHINHKIIPEMIPFGSLGAGLRCITLPIPSVISR